MRNQLSAIFQEYPRPFWTLIGATFIDQVGGFLLLPFFALYVTQKFSVGMTEVGMLFAVFSVTGMAGSTLGGALSDRFGRKWMLIFGLIISALSNVLLGLSNNLQLFYILAAFMGLFASAGGPAQQAMVADLLPEEKRTEGFGLSRVSMNLAAMIGPAIGGFLASRSYLSLFITDAVLSVTTAGIVGLMAMAGYLYLNIRVGQQPRFAVDRVSEAPS